MSLGNHDERGEARLRHCQVVRAVENQAPPFVQSEQRTPQSIPYPADVRTVAAVQTSSVTGHVLELADV